MAHSLSGFRHHAQTPHIAGILAHWLRWESTIRFDASKDEVADIIERHLVCCDCFDELFFANMSVLLGPLRDREWTASTATDAR